MGYRDRGGHRSRLRDSELARQRAMLGVVFQSYNLFPHLTALGNITLGLVRVRGLSKAEAGEKALAWLGRVGLAEKLQAYPAQLSGGQQQRVAIARAFAMNPRLVLLDEITSALDPELVQEVLQTITSLAKEGTTMLIVTHEMRFARNVSDRVLFMDGGEIAEAGSPKELFAAPRHARLKDFLRNAGL
jgi:polar amino acid transport system ATP-binding protein